MASKGVTDLYASGMSIPQVASITGLPLSTVRNQCKKAGILRSRADGVRKAAEEGRLGKSKGKKRTFSEKWKRNISAGRLRHADENARGYRINSAGYKEFTRGEHKGRSEHVVIMESIIGRRIERNEHVHHKDRNKLNNHPSNLQLLTISEHAALHRKEDAAAGITRRRNKNGTWN
ncbi:HNH endonuclease signature motif containing protein [Serratia fonticola]|uniref:HNH endonuclease signature motif containing protein n=1 Tax=Serratia fonticola TaxID=47917 RepID=UPI003AB042E4